ncbi:hypothetical protein Tco_1563416 [Tanacetum coccineum]
MAPRAVLMKTSLKYVNTARPVNTVRSINTGRSFSTAKSFNTVRPSSTAHPKSTIHYARPRTYFQNQAQSTVRRPFYKRTILTKRCFNQRFNTDGCTNSGEAIVHQRKRRIQRRVHQKQKDQEDKVFGTILSVKKMKLVLPRDELVLLSQQLVLLEENSLYCSILQLPVLNQSVNTARITAVGEKVNAAESLLVSTEVNAN